MKSAHRRAWVTREVGGEGGGDQVTEERGAVSRVGGCGRPGVVGNGTLGGPGGTGEVSLRG